MKRSEINKNLAFTKAFFQEMNVYLPRWATWTVDDWKSGACDTSEIVENGLGWDITDFGSGDFEKIGLINFNPRNGSLNKPDKPYCEKIILVKELQVTPLHTHIDKKEDIINRGGGELIIQLRNGDLRGNMNDTDVTVRIDGVPVTVPASGEISLQPGESVYLVPGVYHAFWGKAELGPVLVGEVSSVNDDSKDNIFIDSNPRFPTIEEDEPPLHLLVNDYKKYVA